VRACSARRNPPTGPAHRGRPARRRRRRNGEVQAAGPFDLRRSLELPCAFCRRQFVSADHRGLDLGAQRRVRRRADKHRTPLRCDRAAGARSVIDGLPLRGFVRIRDAESARTKPRLHRAALARTYRRRAMPERDAAIEGAFRVAPLRIGTLEEADGAASLERRSVADDLRTSGSTWALRPVGRAGIRRPCAREARGVAPGRPRLLGPGVFSSGAIGRAAGPWIDLRRRLGTAITSVAGVALGRPSLVANVAVHDAAIVLCIDTSGSMCRPTFADAPARFRREAALTFINGGPDGTRIGLVGVQAASAFHSGGA